MSDQPAVSDPLIERLRAGDKRALVELFQHHRDRLRRMVQLRMDWRLQSRLDDLSRRIHWLRHNGW